MYEFVAWRGWTGLLLLMVTGCVSPELPSGDGGTAVDLGGPPRGDLGVACLARESSCTDGRDEDCDGMADCADADCSGLMACRNCLARESSCTGGADEDCDGMADCADADCAGNTACAPACTPSPENNATACRNGRDDDCDGMVDCADTGCVSPQSGVCAGTFISTSNCQTVLAPPTAGSTTTVTGLTGMFERGYFRTGFRVTFADTAIPALDVQVDMAGTSATILGGAADFTKAPDDRWETCARCALMTFGTKELYPRRGSLEITRLGDAAGSPFEGRFDGELEEVVTSGQDRIPVPGGICLRTAFTFSGTVAGTFNGMLGSRSPPSGNESGFRQMSPPPMCGNGLCDGTETPVGCPADCACGRNSFTVRCANGYSCPTNTECLSRGRCSGCAPEPAGSGRTPLDAVQCSVNDGYCGDDSTQCGVNGDANWSCIRFGCGQAAFRVRCGSGFCPIGTTCTSNQRCACPMNGTVQQVVKQCGGAACPPGGCVYPNWGCYDP